MPPEKAPSASDPFLVEAVRNVALDLAIKNGRVTADDVRRAMPHTPLKRAVFGAAFRLLQTSGQLLPTGYEPSRIPQNHRRRLKVYAPRTGGTHLCP